ncbi:MAG: hypothetical protein SFW62_03820 [Alphaproteobacteria bacterium]|nr:hypothetical protein [Alphaproteobacteria bacterium]
MSDTILTISSLREQWNALQLKALIPAPLTDEQLVAVLYLQQVREKLGDKPVPKDAIIQLKPFYEAMPIAVAHVKRKAAREICALIRGFPSPKAKKELPRRDRYHRRCTRNLDSGRYQAVERVREECKKIHQTLFGTPGKEDDSEFEVGLFRRPRNSTLHADGCGAFYGVEYLLRLNALPYEVVDGARFAVLSNQEKALVRLAQEPLSLLRSQKKYKGADGIGRASRDMLRRKGILRRVPLGEVNLIAPSDSCLPGNRGTLHCSSLTPRRGAHSGLFRYWAWPVSYWT